VYRKGIEAGNVKIIGWKGITVGRNNSFYLGAKLLKTRP
jgi:hypothetical protein